MRRFVFWIGSLVLLAACGGSSGGNDASAAMMAYLQARVEADATKMQNLSCADWEATAAIQAQSFRAMNAQLKDVTCTTGDQDGDFTLVTCDGKIITSYNGENREWELGSYRMTHEDGEWKMCGEAG
ncbi:MAG: hypothetical protein K8I30_06785 [Anaerolineae bacterium]|nr:hypothetical protein [Anaerolineae bacterium]